MTNRLSTHKSFLQLQAEEDCVPDLLEALENICLKVSVRDDRQQLCLIETQHTFGPILVQRELTLGRHTGYQDAYVRLQGVQYLHSNGWSKRR